MVLLLLSGGLLDGDCVSINVEIEPGARLALHNQAATQVHAGYSEQRLSAIVAEDAWFSYVPRALVPHAAADHYATTRVSLAAGARALVADSLSPGRVQFGERFAYRQVRLELDVHSAGELVARERASIQPCAGLRRAQWGSFSHLATAYLVGPSEPPRPADGGDTMRVGATRLARGGWLVRALADRATAVDNLLVDLAAHWWRTCEAPDSGKAQAQVDAANSP
ncbi:MAG: urease accessory protein UreD [Chloroflexota bacterium]